MRLSPLWQRRRAAFIRNGAAVVANSDEPLIAQAWSPIDFGQIISKRRRGRLLFVNKKKQKNFSKLGRADINATGSKEQKFLRRFFKKSIWLY